MAPRSSARAKAREARFKELGHCSVKLRPVPVPRGAVAHPRGAIASKASGGEGLALDHLEGNVATGESPARRQAQSRDISIGLTAEEPSAGGASQAVALRDAKALLKRLRSIAAPGRREAHGGPPPLPRPHGHADRCRVHPPSGFRPRGREPAEALPHLCAAWGWTQANGAPRDMVCRGLMLALARAHLIELPPVRRTPRNPLARRARPAPVEVDGTPLQVSLPELGPLTFRQVRRTAEEAIFNGLIEVHHYLGYTQPVGEHLKFMVYAGTRPVACFAWSSRRATWGRGTATWAGRRQRAGATSASSPTTTAISSCPG